MLSSPDTASCFGFPMTEVPHLSAWKEIIAAKVQADRSLEIIAAQATNAESALHHIKEQKHPISILPASSESLPRGPV